MCGIAGFTHFGRKPIPGVLRRATEKLRHRGPDHEGIVETGDASLSAVRLKIIDLAGGDQPMQTEDGEYLIAFNGEIYNHAEIRRELEALGHRFVSHCDTEVALRAFAQWDLDAFPKFSGMFAIAYWQQSLRRLVLVRDRLGIKPLYYAVRNGNVHFGSELKAVFEHPDVPRRLDREALSYFLSLNYVPGPYTLVEGIRKLQPGGWLECVNGEIRTGEYWSNRFRPERISTEDAVQQLDDLLRKSIAEHLISDVPLGIWASGGLDSSTILHYAAEVSSRPLETFSISFTGRSFDESRYFRLLAERYKTEHHEFDLNRDVDLTSAIHEIAYYSDEPSADAGALPVWFLSKMSRRHVTVALSGEGADEIFGGYQTYLADRYAQRARLLPRWMLQAGLRAADWLPVSDEKISLEYKTKRFLAGALLPADEAHFYWNGTFSSSGESRLEALCERLEAIPSGADAINRYLFVDQNYYLPDDILYKCDRMSMAHSLEVRPPFLDHRIVEFAGRLPSNLKIKGSQTKYVLRELVKQKLPPELLKRRKEGLDIPAHEWLRGPLKPLMLDALSTDSLFPREMIQRIIDQHLSRRANLGYHLWGLITLHLWMRRWNIETPEHSAAENRVFASTEVLC